MTFTTPDYPGIFEGFPVIAFLTLVALISWLYQRTLSQALDNLFEARREAARVEILERDLQIAHDVQQQFYGSPPEYPGQVRFAARSKPAEETGGDFYDFIPLDDDHLAIVVGDVSGKSLPAAIHMAVVRGIMRHGARVNVPAAEVLAQANATTCNDDSINRMITCFYGVLNLKTMELSFANAGHPYVLLKRNGTLESFDAPGFPLNAIADPEYITHTRQLQPDDQLLWISDGIVEAFNPQQELFSFERLETTFAQTNGPAPDAVLEHIWQTVRTFQNGEAQTDDITIVVASIDSQPNTK